MGINGKSTVTDAKVLLLDHDLETFFGTAGGNAICPPEIERMGASFSITLDESVLAELLPEMEEGCELDEEFQVTATISGHKIRLEISVIGNKVISRYGASYEHIRL